MRSTLFARRQLLAALGSWPWAVPAQAAGLSLGVVPNLSARVLATLYQPMRSWLADGLRRPVQVLTAAEFATFHERALAGQYELFVTVPNLGALAVADNRARVLGVGDPGIVPVAVAPAGAAGDPVKALRGRKLALANPASLVAMHGQRWLHEQGLEAGRDYEIVWSPNEDSLTHWFDTGAAPLALMSRSELNAIAPAVRARIAVAHELAPLPGLFVMTPTRIGDEEAERLTGLLRDFFASPASAAFVAGAGMRGLRPLTDADLAQLAPYASATRRALAALR